MGKFLRSLLLAAICFLLMAPQPSLASVGVQEDGGTVYQATNLNVIGATVSRNTTDGSVIDIDIVSSDLVAVGIDESGATTVETGITAIPATYAYYDMVIETITRTLANGTQGQVAVFRGIARVSGTMTLKATTSTGWRSITFDADGETATLLYIDDTTGWVIVGTSGATEDLFYN